MKISSLFIESTPHACHGSSSFPTRSHCLVVNIATHLRTQQRDSMSWAHRVGLKNMAHGVRYDLSDFSKSPRATHATH